MKARNIFTAIAKSVACFLGAAAVVLLILWGFTVADTMKASVYTEPNSVWRCEEADICLVVDKWQECYGMAGTESIYCEFQFMRGARARRDFQIYSAGDISLQEATSMQKGLLALVYQGELKDCDELEFTFRLGRRSLPLWGIKEPTTLHFIREDLPYAADFCDPDNPVFQEFD